MQSTESLGWLVAIGWRPSSSVVSRATWPIFIYKPFGKPILFKAQCILKEIIRGKSKHIWWNILICKSIYINKWVCLNVSTPLVWIRLINTTYIMIEMLILQTSLSKLLLFPVFLPYPFWIYHMCVSCPHFKCSWFILHCTFGQTIGICRFWMFWYWYVSFL